MPAWVASVVVAHHVALLASVSIFAALLLLAGRIRARCIASRLSWLVADILGLVLVAVAYSTYRLLLPHIHNAVLSPFVLSEFACEFPGFSGRIVYPAFVVALVWLAHDRRRIAAWRERWAA